MRFIQRPEFHQTVVAELDFCQEAANARRCKEMLSTTPLVAKGSLAHLQEILWRNHKGAPRAIIPEIIQDLTTSKLLVSSFPYCIGYVLFLKKDISYIVSSFEHHRVNFLTRPCRLKRESRLQIKRL
jgi:hypothetical protein